MKRNSLLLCILLIPVLWVKEVCFFSALVICTFLYARRTKDRTWVFALLLFLLAGMPRTDLSLPSFHEGRVVGISRRYLYVKNGFAQVLVRYTGEPVLLDSRISYDGVYQVIESVPHFFAFDFGRYCRRRGIAYQITPSNITVLKESVSLRGLLQKHIRRHPQRDLLMTILLRQSGSTAEDTDIFIALSGILFFFRGILQTFLAEKKMKQIECGICVLLCGLYHAPYILVQRLLLDVLGLTGIKGRRRIGLGYIGGLLLFPQAVYSPAFLLPFIYRVYAGKKGRCLFLSLFVQCCLFQYCNPISLCLYRFLLPLQGFCWLAALLRCWLPVPLETIVSILGALQEQLALFRLYGSPLGAGLPFFILFCLSFKSHADFKRIATLLLFLLFGLFHPFAEMITIDVGQGSSVLFRAPLGQTNILLDTGRPGAYEQVKAMLDAKGIRKLDYLVISHADSDHSGNRDALLEACRVDQLLEDHVDSYQAGRFLFYDLNPLSTVDENQSSIMSWTMFNGLSVVFPGDCDRISEKAVLDRYPRLQVDIWHAGHHGSQTGNSDAFLDQVRPRLVLISAGLHNRYRHPSEQTLQRLLKRHIPYLNTAYEGDMTLIALPFGNVFYTASGRIGFLSGSR